MLFVSPTNKLHCTYGANVCTVNRFFSIGLTEESKLARFDDEPYNVIVFDEIFFSSIRKLSLIHI